MADVTIELLKTQLRQLRLPTMGREFEKLARDAAATNQTFTQFLLRLTELELASPRRQRGRRRGSRTPEFPVEKDFDTYDFSAMPQLSKPKILELARCEWIDQKSNCCLVGSHGTGKTHISIGLGLAACRAGLRVRFFTAAELVSRLEKEQKQYTLDRFLAPARPGAPADLRRAGLRHDEPRRGRAAVPRLRRPLRARQHPGDEQPAVQRVGPDLPGGADDRGTAGPADPPLPHFRDEWRELPLPRVDEDEEGPKGRVRRGLPLLPRAAIFKTQVGPAYAPEWVPLTRSLPDAGSTGGGTEIVQQGSRDRLLIAPSGAETPPCIAISLGNPPDRERLRRR